MVAIGVMLSYFINCTSLHHSSIPHPHPQPHPNVNTICFLRYSVGISTNGITGPKVWQIPFGFQLVPAGIMALGLLTVKESPRYLASRGRVHDALLNLAYLRRAHPDDEHVRHEMAEIEAAIEEERRARKGLGIKEAFFGKGNFVRFVIAFVIFFLQQWAGQNSVGYYAPQIFKAVCLFMTFVHLLYANNRLLD